MAKTKLNNMLSFKEHSSLDKLSNKPGKILESLNHVERFDDYDNLDEGLKSVLKKIGLVQLSEKEITSKAQDILDDKNKKNRLEKAIKNSSNPKLHSKNYEILKKKGGLPYYSFILYLWKNMSDLNNKRPLYYKISDFGVEDTSIKSPVNSAGT